MPTNTSLSKWMSCSIYVFWGLTPLNPRRSKFGGEQTWTLSWIIRMTSFFTTGWLDGTYQIMSNHSSSLRYYWVTLSQGGCWLGVGQVLTRIWWHLDTHPWINQLMYYSKPARHPCSGEKMCIYCFALGEGVNGRNEIEAHLKICSWHTDKSIIAAALGPDVPIQDGNNLQVIFPILMNLYLCRWFN